MYALIVRPRGTANTSFDLSRWLLFVPDADLQKRAVVLEPDAKRALSLLQQIQAISKDKIEKRKVKKTETKEKRAKKLAKSDEGRKEREKVDKAEHFRKAENKKQSEARKRQRTK